MYVQSQNIFLIHAAIETLWEILNFTTSGMLVPTPVQSSSRNIYRLFSSRKTKHTTDVFNHTWMHSTTTCIWKFRSRCYVPLKVNWRTPGVSTSSSLLEMGCILKPMNVGVRLHGMSTCQKQAVGVPAAFLSALSLQYHTQFKCFWSPNKHYFGTWINAFVTKPDLKARKALCIVPKLAFSSKNRSCRMFKSQNGAFTITHGNMYQSTWSTFKKSAKTGFRSEALLHQAEHRCGRDRWPGVGKCFYNIQKEMLPPFCFTHCAL